jgi:protein-tyrosine-phosphatase
MAEALLRHFSKGRADVFSAGSAPEHQLHRMAKATLENKYGIDTSALHPKSMNQFLDGEFDFVITVCDRVAEKCPVFPNDPDISIGALKIRRRLRRPLRRSGPLTMLPPASLDASASGWLSPRFAND